MSGTPPPPPPPPPGPAPEPAVARESGVPSRPSRVPSAYRMPPSITPSRSGEVPLQRVSAPAAATQAWSAQSPASSPAPTAQHAPVRQAYGQPALAAQTRQYAPQPARGAPTGHQPSAYEPSAYQPAAYAAGAGTAGGDWWAGQSSVGAQHQPQPHPASPGHGGQPYAAAPAQQGPGGHGRRRGLSPGWIAFIAVDALLIIVAIVFAAQIFGGEPLRSDEAGTGAGTSATGAPHDGASAAPSDAASQAPAEVLAEFASPSRNIACQITSAGASCGIAELDRQPAPVEGCEGTTGYVVSIDGQGEVALPCVPSSDQPTKAGGGVDVLEYGETLIEGDFTCSSSPSGMQCQYDPSGRGFTLARAGIGTF